MRPPIPISLDMTKFPLNLAARTRMEFADVACAPIPQDLAALLRRLAVRITRTRVEVWVWLCPKRTEPYRGRYAPAPVHPDQD